MGRSTSSSSVDASRVVRVARDSNCATPVRAEWVICENASNSSSARAEVRFASSIKPGSWASERFAVSSSALVWSIMRMPMIASPTRAIVTTTMQN